jgi:hypothetical protein
VKTLVFVLILALGCWFLYAWLKKQSTPERIQQDPMVRYSTSLQQDVQRAEAARDKANAAIQQEVQSAQKSTQPEETPAQ